MHPFDPARPHAETPLRGAGRGFGGGFTDSLFGAQTSDVLTKGTIWLGSIFMVLTLGLALLYSHRQTSGPKLQEELTKPVAAATNNLVTNPVAPVPAESSASESPAPANP